MNNFKELNVWKKAIQLVVNIYKLTRTFPNEELYGITSQIRRASVSITCNIAEGSAKRSDKDFQRFLDMAVGSAFEVENLLIVSEQLEFLSTDETVKLTSDVIEIQKMIHETD